jgi:hypothetical protein
VAWSQVHGAAGLFAAGDGLTDELDVGWGTVAALELEAEVQVATAFEGEPGDLRPAEVAADRVDRRRPRRPSTAPGSAACPLPGGTVTVTRFGDLPQREVRQPLDRHDPLHRSVLPRSGGGARTARCPRGVLDRQAIGDDTGPTVGLRGRPVAIRRTLRPAAGPPGASAATGATACAVHVGGRWRDVSLASTSSTDAARGKLRRMRSFEAEASAVVAGSPEHVFDLLADDANFFAVRPTAVDHRDIVPLPGGGHSCIQVYEVAGNRVEQRSHCKAFERPRRRVDIGKGTPCSTCC